MPAAQIQTLEGLSAAQIAQSDPSDVADTVNAKIGKLEKQRNLAIGAGVVGIGLVAWLQYRWWVKGGSGACSQKCTELASGY
jgi:hypothetical protein